ncbi:L-type lectin-domain containing receptor kinase I.3 [Raphanus sativus]|nr:L-type lectin-domain containing receptor kinase I.3 [Raphanus sativus]
MDCRLRLVLLFFCIYLTCLSSQEFRFIYKGLDQADLFTDGLAKILPGGLLQLTNTTERQMGHAFFKQSFDFAPSESLLFSTHFVCALVPHKLGADVGHGIAFVVSPSMNLSHALGSNVSINLLSREPIHVWVDYNGSLLNVSLAPINIKKPSQHLMSRSINISEIFKDKIFVGFSASTGQLTTTNGFGRDGLTGRGGFGEVYKGTLPQSRHLAVKRLSHDAEQGMKQFVSEVVTMGSLQHRNLVPLLRYCRRKDTRVGFKSQDRLRPRANLSSAAAVGTIGYMAPELITMGTSTKTDVYAFGAFILEVTCGRRPV